MRRYASGALLALAVTFVTASQAHAAQEPKPQYLKTLVSNSSGNESPAVEDREVDARLSGTMERIRRAFERGDARQLDATLQPDIRIRVSLQSRGEEAGYYRRSQVMFMFDKLFDERQTRSFAFDAPEIDSADERSSHVHAHWSYTVGDDDEAMEHLRFKLLRHDDDWYISEILTAPR